MRKPIFFSFENKILALEIYAKSGAPEASAKFCQILGYELHPMKLAIEQLYRTHFLIEEGLLEKNSSSLILFTFKFCNKQPNIVNPKFLQACSPALAEKISEGLKHLNKKYPVEAQKPYYR